MLPSEKIGDLQAIENKNAIDQGRIACEVRAEPMDKGLGVISKEMRLL